jgi:hypothetical protein
MFTNHVKWDEPSCKACSFFSPSDSRAMYRPPWFKQINEPSRSQSCGKMRSLDLTRVSSDPPPTGFRRMEAFPESNTEYATCRPSADQVGSVAKYVPKVSRDWTPLVSFTTQISAAIPEPLCKAARWPSGDIVMFG